MDNLTDLRALGYRHQPYSAYCRVCWYPIYSGWIDKDNPPGDCILECKNAGHCAEARSRAEFKAMMLELKRQGIIK